MWDADTSEKRRLHREIDAEQRFRDACEKFRAEVDIYFASCPGGQSPNAADDPDVALMSALQASISEREGRLRSLWRMVIGSGGGRGTRVSALDRVLVDGLPAHEFEELGE